MRIASYIGMLISSILLLPGLLWSVGLWMYQPISLVPIFLLVTAWGMVWFKKKH